MQKLRPKSAIQRWTLVLVLLLAIKLIGCQPTPILRPTATLTLKPPPTQSPIVTPEPSPMQSSTSTPEPTPTLPPPEKPVIDPAGKITMDGGKKIGIRASAPGAKGYEWNLQGDGLISDPNKDAILYTAPTPGDGIGIVTVTAHNAHGVSPPTSLIINVLPLANVRLDALGGPFGRMSGTGKSDLIKLESGLKDCYTGSDCLRFMYRPGGEWGVVYWWPFCIGMIMDIRCQETGEWRSVYQGPLCIASIRKQTWDEVQSGTCSINVLEAGNLSSVKRLTFWARGDQGGEIVTFSVGSGGASPKPRSLGRVTLTPRWEPYEIDLEDVDLTNAIILFLWHATDADNPQGAIFYLDDVQFEGKKEAKQPLQSTGQNLADLFTRLCWIAYSPTHFDPTTTPIQWPSEEDVREDLYVLRNAGFNGLVTYRANYTNQDTPDQMLDIPQLAEEVGFEGMIVGVWDPTDEDELRTAEQAGLHPIVVGYSTGNEGLDVRYDLETLASALDRLRRTTGKPVSTTEEVHDYYENSPLWNISDWIFPNVHPYFSGYRDAQEAVAWTEKIFETLESVSDKPLIFKEVGLPSGGDTDLDETGQAQYYRLLRETRITYVVFEAFDAPWKHLGQPEPDGTYPLPDPEPHWGIFTSDRVPKEAVKSICPIRSVGLEQR